MPRKNNLKAIKNKQVLRNMYAGLDLLTAVLLLTGQVTLTGIFTFPDGLSLSMSGPILGGTRVQGSAVVVNGMIDALDVLVAIFLILGQLSLIGPYVGPGGLYIVVGGPLLGASSMPSVTMPSDGKRISGEFREFKEGFRKILTEKYVLQNSGVIQEEAGPWH